MQTTLSIANQKVLAAYAAHAATTREAGQACLRTVYTLGIVQMMMAGDLSELPTIEAP